MAQAAEMQHAGCLAVRAPERGQRRHVARVQHPPLVDGGFWTEKTQACDVAPLGSRKLTFAINIPGQPARYEVEAALMSPGAQPVRSIRDFQVP